jgi:hypothetical protein
MKKQITLAVCLLTGMAGVAMAADSVKPTLFYSERPTLNCLGFQWYVEGDDNHNAKVTLEFRQVGEADWRKALDPWRVKGQRMYSHWNNKEGSYAVTGNLFAGSIMDLQEGTEYECRLKMSDPDGVEGESEKVVKLKTRVPPVTPPGAKVIAFSGDGKSLQQAFAKLQPGDVLEIAAGAYELPAERMGNGFFLNLQGTAEKPITIRGKGKVVIDGKGAFILFDMQNSRHVILEDLEFRGADYAVWCGNAQPASRKGLIVADCKFEKVEKPFSGFKGLANDAVAVGTKPELPAGGRIRYVGGPKKKNADGLFIDPEDGNPVYGSLLAAIRGVYGKPPNDQPRTFSKVRPGDTIIVRGGESLNRRSNASHWGGGLYFQKPFIPLNLKGEPGKPVVIRGVGSPVLDGVGNNRILDLTGCEHVVIEGITFANARQALFVTPQPVESPVVGLTVRRCRFEDIGSGVNNGSGLTRDILVEDSVFRGRLKREYALGIKRNDRRNWPHDEKSQSAVKLAGQGHVVRYNDVRYFFDGIQIRNSAFYPMGLESTAQSGTGVSTPPVAYKTSAVDVLNNYTQFTPDDNEADGVHHNIRYMRNLCLDTFSGAVFSNQPVAGGPVYWVRNVAIGTQGPWKIINGPVGVFMLHNICVSVDSARRGGEKPFGAGGVTTSGWKVTDDKFVDCANVTVSYSGGAAMLSKKPEVSWDKLAATKFDPTGVALPENSPAIDKVTDILPNINDDFEGKAPDAGAIEFGKPVPHYGPRSKEQR